ncbi:hypothetical protein [Streptomyces sp. CBMA123]|uniref:hypothetical protein n=1 Tax=Streptomyces sp. CBMA123 TaxID=1896313 RepID=UPI0016620C29|nr:hypothetical protein [Streptomyces sp. CBMA123]
MFLGRREVEAGRGQPGAHALVELRRSLLGPDLDDPGGTGCPRRADLDGERFQSVQFTLDRDRGGLEHLAVDARAIAGQRVDLLDGHVEIFLGDRGDHVRVQGSDLPQPGEIRADLRLVLRQPQDVRLDPVLVRPVRVTPLPAERHELAHAYASLASW